MHIDAHGGLAQRVKHSKIGDAGHLGNDSGYLFGRFLQHVQAGAEYLDRILAFNAGRSFLNIILDILGKVEIDAGKFALQPGR